MAVVVALLEPERWQTLQCRPGGQRAAGFEFAAVRVWAVRHGEAGPPIWLLVRRSLEPTPEVKYYVSNADAATPLEVLAQVACTRHEVEDYLRGRQELPGDGAVRDAVVGRLAPSHEFGGDGSSVHHADAARSEKKTPELTLDRVVRLLWRAIGIPKLSVEAAIELVNYHINRNRIARNSHMKSWMLKHGNRVEKFVPL